MGNFYQPDGSDLQSLTQINPQHSWDFLQLFTGEAENFTMHRAQQNQPAVLLGTPGRMNQLEAATTAEQTQTQRKRLL